MRARLIGALALVLVAIVTALVVRRQPRAPRNANEAIAVVPVLDGIGRGTPVVYEGTPLVYAGSRGRVGHVDSIERRQDKLILRLRFDNDSGIVRRRGDAVSIRSMGGEKVVALVGAPTYEKPGRVSDTLFLASSRPRRPADVYTLLASLYRPRGLSTPDSSTRR